MERQRIARHAPCASNRDGSPAQPLLIDLTVRGHEIFNRDAADPGPSSGPGPS
ncbi:hypothetical protein ACFPRL_16405 [Pseudoclavibacter helvolus]